ARPAVCGLKTAVAITAAALLVPHAPPSPNHEQFLGIEPNRADRIRAVIVEDRRPCGSGVDRLPNAAGSDGDEIFGAVIRVDGERDHASGCDRRADGTEAQSGEGRRRHRIGRPFLHAAFGTLFASLPTLLSAAP